MQDQGVELTFLCDNFVTVMQPYPYTKNKINLRVFLLHGMCQMRIHINLRKHLYQRNEVIQLYPFLRRNIIQR